MNLAGRKISFERRGLSGVIIEEAKTVISDYGCDSSAIAGDVVHLDEFNNNYVIVETDNANIRPTHGIIIEKTSDTTCKVLTHGKCNFTYSGLVKGKKVFLATNGTLTSTPPLTGYVHAIGLCYETDKIFVNPSEERVKKAV